MAPKDTSSNSKDSGFISALENLRLSINEVGQYGLRISKIDEVQKEMNIALQKRAEADATIEKQQRRISDQLGTIKLLERDKEAAIDTFERKCKTWAREEASLKSDLQNMKSELQNFRAEMGLNQHKELTALKKKTDAQGNQIAVLKGKLDQQVTLNTGLEKRLLHSQREFKGLAHSVGLEEIGQDLYVPFGSC